MHLWQAVVIQRAHGSESDLKRMRWATWRVAEEVEGNVGGECEGEQEKAAPQPLAIRPVDVITETSINKHRGRRQLIGYLREVRPKHIFLSFHRCVFIATNLSAVD